jgi:hypothetical protein
VHQLAGLLATWQGELTTDEFTSVVIRLVGGPADAYFAE